MLIDTWEVKNEGLVGLSFNEKSKLYTLQLRYKSQPNIPPYILTMSACGITIRNTKDMKYFATMAGLPQADNLIYTIKLNDNNRLSYEINQERDEDTVRTEVGETKKSSITFRTRTANV